MTLDRSSLPFTFGPWFARFQELLEIQRRALPPILAGRDVLMCSPTASGKTEAYAAPAAELVRRHKLGHTSVLIIAPTRALTNDLKRRLEGPMALVEVSFGRYTGEHKEKVGGKLPAVVVATPEALDSLLARRPETLRGVRMIVLDEIHVLDNTPRGDQLRVLLHRLEQVADSRPQRVAASATVDSPRELAARYLQDAELVVVPGARKILARAFDGRGVAYMGQHLDDLAGHGFKKLLVFCRSRNQVEAFSTKLRNQTRFGEAIFGHHGSLAKSARERTERIFHLAPAAVCFATLTLEMGIDIGTVDYVLLADVPTDVSSLLQRIGRGGRRADATRCGYVVENAGEQHLFQTMFRLGKEGHLCGRPYGFRPSILVQQALVLACAETYVCASDLRRALPPSLLKELGDGACEQVLDAMVAKELLELSGRDRYVPSEMVEQRYEHGSLHSNIDDTASVQVVDRITGDVLGTIQSPDSGKIEIGGRGRKVVKVTEGRILTDASADATPAFFRPSASPSVSFALGRAVVESFGVARASVGLLNMAGVTVLLHGLGTVGSLLLIDQWKTLAGAPAIREHSPYTMLIAAPPKGLPRPSEEHLANFLSERVAGLSKLMQAGPWARGVPDYLTLTAVRKTSGLEEVVAFLQVAEFQNLKGLDAQVIAEL